METIWRTEFISQRNGQALGRFVGETPLARTFGESWSPSVDISETKNSLVVKADLPGLDAEDVNVSNYYQFGIKSFY